MGPQGTQAKKSPNKTQRVVAGIVIGLGIGIYALYQLGILQKIKYPSTPPSSHERVVVGVILDATTNDPVPGVKVYPEEESTDIYVTTNQGDFRLPISDDFKGDTLTLHAIKEGYASARQQARVPSSHNPILLAKAGTTQSVIEPTHVSVPDNGHETGAVLVGNGSPACTFYGEANPGSPAWNKDDSCIIPRVELLDSGYHQGNFGCCGGGATSPTTAADVPPGMELRTSGRVYWSVRDPKLRGDQFSIHTYCGPPGNSWEGGCNVRVDVIPHYRAQ